MTYEYRRAPYGDPAFDALASFVARRIPDIAAVPYVGGTRFLDVYRAFVASGENELEEPAVVVHHEHPMSVAIRDDKEHRPEPLTLHRGWSYHPKTDDYKREIPPALAVETSSSLNHWQQDQVTAYAGLLTLLCTKQISPDNGVSRILPAVYASAEPVSYQIEDCDITTQLYVSEAYPDKIAAVSEIVSIDGDESDPMIFHEYMAAATDIPTAEAVLVNNARTWDLIERGRSIHASPLQSIDKTVRHAVGITIASLAFEISPWLEQ
jgi:hypothetical protein